MRAPELNPETDCRSPGPAAPAGASGWGRLASLSHRAGNDRGGGPKRGGRDSPGGSGDLQEPLLCAALLCTPGPGRRAGPSAPARRPNSARPTRHLRAPPPHPCPASRQAGQRRPPGALLPPTCACFSPRGSEKFHSPGKLESVPTSRPRPGGITVNTQPQRLFTAPSHHSADKLRLWVGFLAPGERAGLSFPAGA